MAERLILASASAARARLLAAAGVTAEIVPAAVDEDAVKQAFRRDGGAAETCALALAEAKARAVAARYPQALVLGADQILAAGDDWFDKPADRAAARDQLLRLGGKTHTLATAACVVRGDTRLWQTVSQPRLTMRRFGDAFVDAYLAAEGDAVLGSVGAYRLEGPGVQLFARIDGDHFAIQGLPLLELLDFLRGRGTIPA